MNTPQLHILIERYFDGLTSLEEERTLRSLLASVAPGSDPLADEARAVMGFSLASPLPAPAKRPARRRLSPALRAWSGAAAAAVILFAIGWSVQHTAPQSSEQCVAYIDGRAVTDHSAVMALVHTDLAALGSASGNVNSEISSEMSQMSEAFNNL